MCLPKLGLGLVGLLLGTLVGMTAASAQEPETDTIEVCVAIGQGYTTGQWQGHGYVREPFLINVGAGPRCERYEAFNEVVMRPLDSVAPGRWLMGQYQRDLYGRRETITVSLYQSIDDPSLLFLAVNEGPARHIMLEGPRHARRAHVAFDVWSEYLAAARQMAEAQRETEGEKAGPAPAPSPTPEPEPSIKVILETSSTRQPVTNATVEANHPIPAEQAILFVAAQGKWHGSYSGRALEPHVPAANFGGHLFTWQDVVEVKLRTLAGATLRHWTCDQAEDRHAIKGEYDCKIGEEQALPSLSNEENPDLWVYIVNRRSDGILDIHVRAGVEGIGNITVRAEGEDVSVEDRTYDRPLTEVDEVVDLKAGGGRNKDRGHEHVVTVRVSSTGLGLLRCERHQDSDEDRSVWACVVW